MTPSPSPSPSPSASWSTSKLTSVSTRPSFSAGNRRNDDDPSRVSARSTCAANHIPPRAMSFPISLPGY